MTKLKVCTVLVVVASLCAGLFLQHASVARLQAQVSNLGRLADENTLLRSENERLSKQVLQLGAGAAATRSASAAGQPSAIKGPPDYGSPAQLAAGLVPVISLGNAGRATPRAALATQMWAARTGDVALEASTLLLGQAERAKLEALLPLLPADVRRQYGTAEQLMAFALAGSPHPVGGMQVLGETSDSPDDVTLQTEWQHEDDTVVHQSQVTFHREEDGWKMVVPPIMVDRAAAYLGRM
jgi:hypothetical protein